MTFDSYIFVLVYLPLCVWGYFVVGKINNRKLANLFLVIISLIFVFYGFDERGLISLVFSIVFNYMCYRGTIKFKNKKIILAGAIVINIVLLLSLKYQNMFAYRLGSLFHMDFSILQIILPLGISFYTFQQIAFLVDAYRNEIPSCSFLDYTCFVSFFPRIISGPIIRHEQFLPQLCDNERLKFNWDNFAKGLYRFAMGMGKKVLIADVLAGAANLVFDNPQNYYGIDIIIGSLAFTLQLYFDFSGYCDMAIGISKMINFDIPENFNSPYKATNIKEFWNRWHITLTGFLTKYVYIPLGGSRKGKVRTYINILLVFLVSGLWHGSASMKPFLLWGLLHGIAMIIYRLCSKWIDRFPRAVNWFITFSFVSLAWIPFRVQSISGTMIMIKNMFSAGHFAPVGEDLILAFQSKEMSFIESLFPHLTVFSTSPWIYPMAFLAVVFFILLGTQNENEITENFRPTVCKSIFASVVLTWSVISFTGVGTFIYAGF